MDFCIREREREQKVQCRVTRKSGEKTTIYVLYLGQLPARDKERKRKQRDIAEASGLTSAPWPIYIYSRI